MLRCLKNVHGKETFFTLCPRGLGHQAENLSHNSQKNTLLHRDYALQFIVQLKTTGANWSFIVQVYLQGQVFKPKLRHPN